MPMDSSHDSTLVLTSERRIQLSIQVSFCRNRLHCSSLKLDFSGPAHTGAVEAGSFNQVQGPCPRR